MEQIEEKDYKYFSVYSDGKYGVINENGELIIQNIYDTVTVPNPTKPVFICKKQDGTIDILNENNEKIFTKFEKTQAIETNGIETNAPYEKSLLKYEKDGKFGLINFEGKAITKPIYEEISSVKYKEGEILAKKDGKYGVINNKGKVLIPFEYDEIEGDRYQNNGYKETGYIVKAKTSNGHKFGYINSEWKKMLEPEYNEVTRILDIKSEDVYIIAAKNGRYGLIKNKEEKVDFLYKSIMYNNDINLLSVEKNDKYGVLSLEGKTVVPVEYNQIRFSGIYIYAKGYTEDKYFDANGNKVENGFTGMKEISKANCYITTDGENLYGLADKERK